MSAEKNPTDFGYVDVPLIDEDDTMVQGELFPVSDVEEPVRGYRGTVASKIARITYRQLDYWARKRIVVPSITPSHGSGSRRLYSFTDIVILAVSKKLLDIGVNLQNVTNAVEYLMKQPSWRLSHMTIVCDGETVQECGQNEDVAAMLASGEAVFCVSVAAMWNRIAQACESEQYVELTDTVQSTMTSIDDYAIEHLRHTMQLRRKHREELAGMHGYIAQDIDTVLDHLEPSGV